MFNTVLVANRGEIALRVMRACKELGLRTVAVYSEADRAAPHVAYADDAYLIGPGPAAQSYLDAAAIIAAAQRAGAQAIHPGYGFLAENAAFVQACTAAGLVFIGPPASAIERMGGKTAARREAIAAGVPVVPGTTEPVADADAVRALGAEYDYPVAIKAVGGGGGRGLRVVHRPEDADAAFDSARREAIGAFKNPDLYVERYLQDPRHIEIQVLADAHGTVLTLGERDCSIQRRHQKLVEECPSPAIDAATRAAMGRDAIALARAVGYVSAGTLEFLYENGHYYFLEMNTRIQVEHTVTEMVTGVDLVQAQIRIAQNEALWLTQADIQWRGHAIQCRINAEDPSAGFRPALGTIGAYREPVGYGVRVDAAAHAGYTIPSFYDSMIAKLVTWGGTRAEAIGRMRRALNDYELTGVPSTLGFHQLVMAHPAFAAGEATVNFIPRYLADQLATLAPNEATVTAPEIEPASARVFEVEVNGKRFAVRVAEPNPPTARTNGAPAMATTAPARRTPTRRAQAAIDPNAVMSPIQGTVAAVKVAAGDAVSAGQTVAVVEAMKMENEITAPRAGIIAELRTAAGQSVEAGAILATLQVQ